MVLPTTSRQAALTAAQMHQALRTSANQRKDHPAQWRGAARASSTAVRVHHPCVWGPTDHPALATGRSSRQWNRWAALSRHGSSEGGIPPPEGGGPGPASAPVRGKQCSAASACARGVIVLRRLNKSLMGEITHAHLKRNVIKRLGDRG